MARQLFVLAVVLAQVQAIPVGREAGEMPETQQLQILVAAVAVKTVLAAMLATAALASS
jgi:hypothetical protein